MQVRVARGMPNHDFPASSECGVTSLMMLCSARLAEKKARPCSVMTTMWRDPSTCCCSVHAAPTGIGSSRTATLARVNNDVGGLVALCRRRSIHDYSGICNITDRKGKEKAVTTPLGDSFICKAFAPPPRAACSPSEHETMTGGDSRVVSDRLHREVRLMPNEILAECPTQPVLPVRRGNKPARNRRLLLTASVAFGPRLTSRPVSARDGVDRLTSWIGFVTKLVVVQKKTFLERVSQTIFGREAA